MGRSCTEQSYLTLKFRNEAHLHPDLAPGQVPGFEGGHLQGFTLESSIHQLGPLPDVQRQTLGLLSGQHFHNNNTPAPIFLTLIRDIERSLRRRRFTVCQARALAPLSESGSIATELFYGQQSGLRVPRMEQHDALLGPCTQFQLMH